MIPAVQSEGFRRAALSWLVAWLTVAVLIAATRYETRDPDSQLYAGISARLVSEPVSRWIAPQWWGFWHSQGPYCEHPVGMFVVPALLARAGYPAPQAAYAVNALYQVICFALMTLIAATVTSRSDARALGSILQLLPIAFVFRVRANQEYAVLAGVLFALYATERARTRPVWGVGMLAGFCAVLLVKGVFAAMVPIVCVLWLISRRAPTAGWSDDRGAWAAVATMPVAGALVAWGYETAYMHVTGQSFLEIYRSRQLPDDAIAGQSPIVRTAYTTAWYTTRLAWYSFPWSLMAVGFAAGCVRSGRWLPWQQRAAVADAGRSSAFQGAWFAFVSAVLLAAAFSLAHRKADRYIFPAYFLIAAAGAAPALARYPRLGRIAGRADRPWVPAALYVVLVLLTIVSSGKLPVFTFWRT
jgi:4-amino-4-deoxy-L-arabinose transferase-like glycosyltransferase